jgi:hypothetical protein
MWAETANSSVHRRHTCRVCGHAGPERILSLGPTPLANSFLRSPDEFAAEPSYPLDLYFCGDCSLLQLLDVVDPEVMFRHYLYVTGTSTTIADHNRTYASLMTGLLHLGPSDLVVEAASNDGSLLRCFRDLGIRTLGIEPARNLAVQASESGIETVNEFLSIPLAESIRAARRPARLVAANNVLAHVDEPGDFLAACRALVADDGLVTIEVPYVRDLLDRLEYDTVYHEHLSYFSVTALLRLCGRVGLAAVRIDRVPVHGGSLRLYLSRSAPGHSSEALGVQAAEQAAGIVDVARYRRFAGDVLEHREQLVGLLSRLKAEHKQVVGYGAPAKGNTLLNFCRIDTTLLGYTVDKNPLKVGLLTPGSHIPVKEVSALIDQRPIPDYALILAWNFAEEIMRQQQVFRDLGGRFIVPVPEPQVI